MQAPERVLKHVPRLSPEGAVLALERVLEQAPQPSAERAEPSPGQGPPVPPAPGTLAPSPELVHALTGKNPAPQVTIVPRLRQDVTVKPEVPRLLPLERPISPSSRQNAQLQADLKYLDKLGAENFRVNQQQLTFRSGQRVGINRPDLQFDYNDRRYHVEYDSPASGRGPGHQSRIISNDPDAEVILIIVP